ncbi:hypothetical protein Tco_1262772 [Tanacetum coccineum]
MIVSLMYLTASRLDIQFLTRKSTLGACQLLGGKLVCWSAKKQQSVAMSLVELEYVAATGCCAKILWMKSQLTNYDIIYVKVEFNFDDIPSIPTMRLHYCILHILNQNTFRYSGEFGEKELLKRVSFLLDVHVDSKAPKTSSKVEKRVSHGKNPGAHTGLRRNSSRHTFESKTKANEVDTNPSQPLVSTPVDTGMHKQDQQAAGGPTSLGATSEEAAHPQLSSGCDASEDSIAEVHLGISATNDSIPQQQDSPKDEHIFVQDENTEEEEVDKYEDTHATSYEKTEDPSVPHPSSPKIVQLIELTNQVLLLQSLNKKLEQQNNKAEAEVALLTAQPSYPNVDQLSQLLLPEDLKEITNKLETFTSTVSNLTSQVAELKTLQWELSIELRALPSQVSSVHAKIKTLDALPSLPNKVTDTLNRFAHILENASPKAGDKSVPLAGQAGTSPAEREKNTNQATISQLFQ